MQTATTWERPPARYGAPKRALEHMERAASATGVLALLVLAMPFGADWARKPEILTFALPGACLVYLALRPPGRHVLWTALAGGVLYGASARLGWTMYQHAAVLGAALGWCCLVALGLAAFTRDERGALARPAFRGAMLLGSFSAAVPFLFRWTVQSAPLTWDSYLLRFDANFGGQPAFLAAQWLRGWPALYAVAQAGYLLLPTGMAGLYALQMAARRREPNLVLTLACAALAGWTFYFLYPAAGPIFAYPSIFPDSPPAVGFATPEPLPVPAAPRNCMPSLHTAWALLLFWASQGFPGWVRIGMGVFLVLTLTATLGLGEHYLVDLIVAAPFSLAIYAACSSRAVPWRGARALSCAAGAALTVAWVAALASPSVVRMSTPFAAYLATGVTLALCCLLKLRLNRAAR